MSGKRAQSVLDYFSGQNVNSLHLEAYGRGKTAPRVDNNTEAGRQLNRRVELWILPVVANEYCLRLLIECKPDSRCD